MLVASISTLAAADDTDQNIAARDATAFFEARIRPVLVERCYECHNSAETAEGNLALDHRDGWATGGDSGPAIVPGKPDQSPLIQAIRHDDDVSAMPDDADKLSDEVIADFVQWVAGGAVDPRDKPPSPADADRAAAWQETLAEPSNGGASSRSRGPMCRSVTMSTLQTIRSIVSSIAVRLAEVNLTPAVPIERCALVRRLWFVLTGLPPSPEEVEAFAAATEPT